MLARVLAAPLAILTGVLATVAIYYTAHNATTARRALAHNQEVARRTAELTEQGQVTERYTKAIEQLGSGTLDIPPWRHLRPGAHRPRL